MNVECPTQEKAKSNVRRHVYPSTDTNTHTIRKNSLKRYSWRDFPKMFGH